MNNKKARRIEMHIEPVAMKIINETVFSDTSNEVGGLMLGKVLSDETGFKVNVAAAIGAKYTELERTDVKFTSRSWHYMEQVRMEKYSDLEVLGWFHTHPGKGIYLSTYHTFIHHNFFAQPWQMALVMDPLAGTHSFFGWNNGKITRLQYEFSGPVGSNQDQGLSYVFNIIDMAEKKNPWDNGALSLETYGCGLKSDAGDDNIWRDEAVRTNKGSGWAGSLCLAGILMLAFCCGFLGWNTFNIRHNLDAANDRLAAVEKQILHPGDASAVNNSDSIQNDKAGTVEQNNNEQVDTEYTVQEGDTFWIISQRTYNNGAYYKEIAKFNNLSENATLKPGQNIKLPPLNTQ